MFKTVGEIKGNSIRDLPGLYRHTFVNETPYRIQIFAVQIHRRRDLGTTFDVMEVAHVHTFEVNTVLKDRKNIAQPGKEQQYP